VKTTISDLGCIRDYSEYFIGHSGSAAGERIGKRREMTFRKNRPYLTFLNIAGKRQRCEHHEQEISSGRK